MADGCTLLILAGGHSRRMGRDKASLPVSHGEAGTRLTFVQHIAGRLAPMADEVIVAAGASKAAVPGLRVVTDQFADLGPLAGMHAGFLAASHPLVWVVACDLPDVEPQLGPLMRGLAADVDAVVPRLNDRADGLCAIYQRQLAPRMKALLETGERSVQHLLAGIRVRWLEAEDVRRVDPQLRSFRNINTPAEYEAWVSRR